MDSLGDPVEVCGTEGDKLVVLQLPFGSFTGDQPAAAVTVGTSVSNFADLNAPLTIEANAGFQFGSDPLDNPTTDPSIIGSSTATASRPS